MTEECEFPQLVLENKNKTDVRCQYCNSFILRQQHGEYCENEIELPLMQQKREKSSSETFETEPLRHFWLVKDMITFENIGFSHTVDNRKFLVCADCENGPVGYHELSNKYCYVALRRVAHPSESTK